MFKFNQTKNFTMMAVLTVCMVQVNATPVAPVPIDDFFSSKAEACSACRSSASGNCAMYKSCICHAASIINHSQMGMADNEKTWVWACGGEGGSQYELCFKEVPGVTDHFGDRIDPSNPKCP